MTSFSGNDVTKAYLLFFWQGHSGLCFICFPYKQDFECGAYPCQKILPLKILRCYLFLSLVLNFCLARVSAVVKIAKIYRNFFQNTTKSHSVTGSVAYKFTSGDCIMKNIAVTSLMYLINISGYFKPHGFSPPTGPLIGVSDFAPMLGPLEDLYCFSNISECLFTITWGLIYY